MKKHRGKPIVQITNPDIDEYSHTHTTPESKDLSELIQSSDEALEYIDMLSGRVVGQFLKMLVKISGARRILEIGTFTGYSALMMAEALPDNGEIITLEMNLKYQDIARKHFKKYEAGKKVKMATGNAQKTIKKLDGEFDLVFMDGDKLQYPFYFEACLPLVKSGGLIVADNVLWNGTVLNPEDKKAQAINEFNKLVAENNYVEQVLLTVRDGITIIRKL